MQRNSFEYELALYVNSMYFALATMTTVGYGDVKAMNSDEKKWTILILLASIVSFSACIGMITELVRQLSSDTVVWRSRMSELTRYMSWRNIPKHVKKSLVSYLQHVWEKERDFEEKQTRLFSVLSPALKQEAHMYVFGTKHKLASARFLAWVAPHGVALEMIIAQASAVHVDMAVYLTGGGVLWGR